VCSHRACAQDFYGTTLDALVEAKNERLWFKTQLKLCGLWFRLREFGRAQRILRELHRRACTWSEVSCFQC
jgi:COP9 signalosome complex subunit 2